MNVNQGKLLVNGLSASSAFTVAGAGAILGGTGVVGGVTVNSDAILLGGDDAAASGALSSGGNVSFLDSSIIKLTLGSGGTHSSLARTGGTWSFDSDQTFTFTINPGATAGVYDNVITGLGGTESGLATIGSWLIDPATGATGSFAYDGAGGVDMTIDIIPEPGSAALLLVSIPLVGLRRWRNPKRK
jgi:hypothetical protein